MDCIYVLPIETGYRVGRFKAAEERVNRMRPELKGNVTSYGWHGTRGVHANAIKKTGFDMSKISRK